MQAKIYRRYDYFLALASVLLLTALAYLLYHSLAGGTLLDPNLYDSYSLQAENWLAGRNYIANGEKYTWLELAIYDGRYYQSFPPTPAVLMLPFVLLCGSAAAVPANMIIALLSLLGATGVFACFWRRGSTPVTAAYFAMFVALGSNCFWIGCSGGVWFIAQTLGLCLAVWSLYFAQSRSPWACAMAGFLLAAAVGCRPFYALLLTFFLLFIGWNSAQNKWSQHCLMVAILPVVCVAVAMMAYNYARFGSVLEFGHNYLPEFMREFDGQFSPGYLLPNLLNLLRPVMLNARLQLEFPVFNGFLPLIANPLFLLWACSLLRSLRSGDVANTLSVPVYGRGGILFFTVLLLLILTCMHRTLGGWQFGARYTVDTFPYVLLWYLARPHYKPNAAAWTLFGAAALFNLYGAVFMLSA